MEWPEARPYLAGAGHDFVGPWLALLVFIAIFGVGSIGGMAIMSALFALPSRLSAQRFSNTELSFRGIAGLASLGLGAFTVYQIGFVTSFATRENGESGAAS
jgi:hypothetical protein